MESFDAKQRAHEKQASRDEDARRLASGEVSPEQLRRENGAFSRFARAEIVWSELLRRGPR